MPQGRCKTLDVEDQERRFDVRNESADVEKRTVELSFSSEIALHRSFGIEILDHAPAAVRLHRLNNGGPLLHDHDTREQIGVIEKAEIAGDRKGRAVVRFSRSTKGQEIFQDVVDGIRKNVSVGYRIHKVRVEEKTDETTTYRVTDWEPLEVSIVGVAADISVGVGRGINREVRKVPIENVFEDEPPTKKEANKMPEVDIERTKAEARQAESKRVNDILSLGEQHNCMELARKAVKEDKSVDDFRDEVLRTVYKAKPVAQGETAKIGMSDKDVRRFSLIRAINALANPTDRQARDAAAFEFECSDAQGKKLKKQPQGFFIPRDVMEHQAEARDLSRLERLITMLLQRDLVVGTATAGGHLVATELLAANFIDLLRNRMMVRRLGATILGGLVGDIAIPRQTGGATAYWVAESGAPTESQQAFDQVAMTPKTVGAFTDISRKLLLQSSVDVEAFVRRDLATVLALELDRAAINGSGASNEPRGILNVTGIGDVPGGTNGAAPTWAHVVNLETEVAIDNADIGALAYFTNAKVRGKLKQTEKAANTAQFIWELMQADPGFGLLNGYRAGVSNQVPSNLTKGTGTNLSAILFGNWADLIIGEWGAVDVLVDPYTGGAAGTVRVRLLQDADINVRHPESFSAMKDAITT